MAQDLRSEFPDMHGFSSRNLKYMRAFADAWPEKAIVQQLAAQLPWFHNCTLLDKVKDAVERTWYTEQTIQNGWSRKPLSIAEFRHLEKLPDQLKGTLPTIEEIEAELVG